MIRPQAEAKRPSQLSGLSLQNNMARRLKTDFTQGPPIGHKHRSLTFALSFTTQTKSGSLKTEIWVTTSIRYRFIFLGTPRKKEEEEEKSPLASASRPKTEGGLAPSVSFFWCAAVSGRRKECRPSEGAWSTKRKHPQSSYKKGWLVDFGLLVGLVGLVGRSIGWLFGWVGG